LTGYEPGSAIVCCHNVIGVLLFPGYEKLYTSLSPKSYDTTALFGGSYLPETYMEKEEDCLKPCMTGTQGLFRHTSRPTQARKLCMAGTPQGLFRHGSPAQQAHT